MRILYRVQEREVQRPVSTKLTYYCRCVIKACPSGFDMDLTI